MNKGFEVIEAYWLFGIDPSNIDITIHPTSIVHAFVHFKDGSTKAQMGIPNMVTPIQYALNYPNRIKNSQPRYSPNNNQDKKEIKEEKKSKLEFWPPDYERFPCLGLAYKALSQGGTAPAVLNGADERAVALFLDGKIGFLDIPRAIESALNAHKLVDNPNFAQLFEADRWAREHVNSFLRQ